MLRETARKRPELVFEWLLPRASRASGVTVREAVKPLSQGRRDAVLAARRAPRAPERPGVESTRMAEPLFNGVGVALVTLFRDDGTLDAAATAAHAACLVDLGVSAVVVAGTTGGRPPWMPPSAPRCSPRSVTPFPFSGVPVIAGTARRRAGRPPRSPRPPRRRCRRRACTVASGQHRCPPVLRDRRSCRGRSSLPRLLAAGYPVQTLREIPVGGCKDSSADPDRMPETLCLGRAALSRILVPPVACRPLGLRRGDPGPRKRRAGALCGRLCR
ncbi:MAG: dihydrodipicolinate synthase family protein [Actinomycetota bacterium]